MILKTLKKSLKWKWERINLSNDTKSFVIMSLLQAITLIILQIRIALRNTSLSDQMESYLEQNKTLAASCEMVLADNRLTLLFAENFCFIFFQIFQFYFCSHAIVHQNMIQIFVILGLDIANALYGIVQQDEVAIELNIITASCPGVYQLSPYYESYEYPNVIVSSAFALAKLILTWRLFILFERKMYEKPDIELHKPTLYRKMLIFVMMLKLAAFLVVINASLTAAIIPFLGRQSMMFVIAYAIHASILLFSIPALILAFNSFIRQWKIGMYIFLVFWVFFVADFAFLIKDGISAASDGWYFWISTIFVTLITALVSDN
ncbi:13510_t:CDS:2 [Dentiscutata erythropus]|uniref:13510_t:CDS:1 n=1 Tax=Dentiscutata erythropus TaxID=1348616 RepID=A0A9N8YMA0_9GLOM|nr:13510_t:CDS:2 [Dentiscutata erythropus]